MKKRKKLPHIHGKTVWKGGGDIELQNTCLTHSVQEKLLEARIVDKTTSLYVVFVVEENNILHLVKSRYGFCFFSLQGYILCEILW